MVKISTLWKRLGDVSLVQWVVTLFFPGAGAVLVGWLAVWGQQAAWIVVLAAAAMFALVSWGLAAWRSHRISSLRASSFDDLRARVRDEKLAEMLGNEDAENAYRNKVGLASMGLDGFGLGISRKLAEAEEIRRAKHKGLLKRLEEGKDE